MAKRDESGRFAPKTPEQDVRPIDQMRQAEVSQPTTAPATREELMAQLAELEQRENPPRMERFDPEQYHRAHADQGDRPPVFTPGGCLQVVLVGLLLTVLGWLVIDKLTGSDVAPAPSPAPAPAVDLSAYTAPIADKLAADPVKAERVANVYEGFRKALAGRSGARVINSQVLEQIQGAYLDDLQTTSGVSVGAEIDTAIGTYLGLARTKDEKTGELGWEPKTFDDADRAKLVEIIGAISRAAGGVR